MAVVWDTKKGKYVNTETGDTYGPVTGEMLASGHEDLREWWDAGAPGTENLTAEEWERAGYTYDSTTDSWVGGTYDEEGNYITTTRYPAGGGGAIEPGVGAWDPGLWVGGPPGEGVGGGPKLGGVEPIGGYPPVGGIMAPEWVDATIYTAEEQEPWVDPEAEADWWNKLFGGYWGIAPYKEARDPSEAFVDEVVLIPGALTRVTWADGTVTFAEPRYGMRVDEVTAMEMYADYQAKRPTAEAGVPIVARWEVVEDQGERFYVGYDAQGNIIETQYLGSAPTAEMTEWQKEQIDLRERERKDAIQQDRRRREQELELAELSRLPPEISEYQQGMLDLQQQEFEWRQQQDGQLSPWQEEQLRLSREQLEWQQQQFGELSAWQQEQIGLEQQQFGELSAWQQAQMGLEQEQFGELSAWQQAQLGLEEQQFGELSAWQEAQMGLEEQELAWRREQHGTLSAWQEEQLGLAREELALEQKNYLAGLAAQPHSWLEYSMAAGETPVVQPWMKPLMPQEYAELGAGAPIPGWQGLAPQGQLGAGAVGTQQSPYQETEMWTGQPTTPTGYQPPAVTPTTGAAGITQTPYDPYALPAGYEVAIPEIGGYERFATATGIPDPLSTGGAATIGTTARGLMIPSDELLAMLQPSYDLSKPEQKAMALEMWYRQNITPQGWAARVARAKGDSVIRSFARARGIPIENMALLAPPGGRRPIPQAGQYQQPQMTQQQPVLEYQQWQAGQPTQSTPSYQPTPPQYGDYGAVAQRMAELGATPERIAERMAGYGGQPTSAVGLQRGGIVTRPTMALLGEAGPEAVVPLKRGGGTTPTPMQIGTSTYQPRTGEYTTRLPQPTYQPAPKPTYQPAPKPTYKPIETEEEQYARLGIRLNEEKGMWEYINKPAPTPSTGWTGVATQPASMGTFDATLAALGLPAGSYDRSTLMELLRPSRQYQARMGPTAFGQYAGYEQMRTGIRPEELEFRLWSMAPPGGRHRGLTYMR